ncbi:MAG: hypothetical protein ACI4IT_03725 [Oscillospiraceae bacterium]
MEKWVILIFVAVFLVCSFFVKRFMIRMINSAERQSAVAAINSKEDSPLDYWQESGNSRKFENADYPLPEEDFFENEMTELPSLEEALSGLSESEAEEIMKIAEISNGEDEHGE